MRPYVLFFLYVASGTSDEGTLAPGDEEKGLRCFSAMDEGGCQNTDGKGNNSKPVLQYYFDSQTRCCKPFVYMGCGGNGNRFQNETECVLTCKGRNPDGSTDPPSYEDESMEADIEVFRVRCLQEKDFGRCCRHTNKREWRYYYDPLRAECRLFHFAGCGGNANNYPTSEACMKACYIRVKRPPKQDSNLECVGDDDPEEPSSPKKKSKNATSDEGTETDSSTEDKKGATGYNTHGNITETSSEPSREPPPPVPGNGTLNGSGSDNGVNETETSTAHNLDDVSSGTHESQHPPGPPDTPPAPEPTLPGDGDTSNYNSSNKGNEKNASTVDENDGIDYNTHGNITDTSPEPSPRPPPAPGNGTLNDDGSDNGINETETSTLHNLDDVISGSHEAQHPPRPPATPPAPKPTTPGDGVRPNDNRSKEAPRATTEKRGRRSKEGFVKFCREIPDDGARCELREHDGYYYDGEKEPRECRQYHFFGCESGNNHFETLSQCKKYCDSHPYSNYTSFYYLPWTEKSMCLAPPDTGMRCTATQPNRTLNYFYYNSSAQTCMELKYAGCGGNRNKYSTREKCERRCSGVKHSEYTEYYEQVTT